MTEGLAGIGLFDDAAGLPQPGEDPPDLRAVAIGGDLSGTEDGHHVIFRRWPQQAHPSLGGPGARSRAKSVAHAGAAGRW